MMKSSCNLLLCYVNDILDVYMIKNGTFSKIEEMFKLKSLINEVLSMFRNQAEDKKLALKFWADDMLPLPHSVVSDMRRLKQILINLVSNALKFTTKGSITITCRYEDYTLFFEV